MKNGNTGRASAYALLAVGAGTTLAANVAHAHPNIGAKALSAVVPILLFIAFHVAALDGRWHVRLTTGIVAGFSFSISYDHISGLARRYGESAHSAVLYPLAVDGAMIIATFVLSRSVSTPPDSGLVPVPVPVPVPVLQVEVPEYVELVPETGNRKSETGISVPEFAAPPASAAPFVPEFVRPEFVPEDILSEVPVSGSGIPVSPAPTSGARAEKLARDLTLMEETFGQRRPGTTEIMRELNCGGSRATRLQEVWESHLELIGSER